MFFPCVASVVASSAKAAYITYVYARLNLRLRFTETLYRSCYAIFIANVGAEHEAYRFLVTEGHLVPFRL